jgi:hypothetical protein
MINYQSFWGGFLEHAHELKQLFEYVCSDIKQDVTIMSVFGHSGFNKNNVSIIFSAEPCNGMLLPSPTINLIMASTEEDNVITTPCFAVYSYERNCWPIYKTPRIIQKIPEKFCAFVVGNGGCHIRNTFMELLNNYSRVDSGGNFRNNIGINAPHDHGEYMKFLSNYRFNICFENGKHPVYITEKLVNAYISGSIPIYWGATKVREWFNPNAFFYLEDDSEQGMINLIEQIKIVDSDPVKYLKMQSEPLIIGDIPDCMNKDIWKQKINEYLKINV